MLFKDWLLGKMPFGARRSSKWPGLRDEHLRNNPKCEVCGATDNLEVHHDLPVHLFPEYELEPKHLTTLCEKGCHLIFGHLKNYKSYNPYLFSDAKVWREKIRNRPKG